MFRLQSKVPEVYVEESRDFQLFCRLYDIVFNSTKGSINSIVYTKNTDNCSEVLLDPLKSKLGFFSGDLNLDSADLRRVLSLFPEIIKNKGSRRGIDLILILFQHLVKIESRCGEANYETMNDGYELHLTFYAPITNIDLLIKLLEFVLPTGYLIKITFVTPKSTTSSIIIEDRVLYAEAKGQAGVFKGNDDTSYLLHTGIVQGAIIWEEELEEKSEKGETTNDQP